MKYFRKIIVPVLLFSLLFISCYDEMVNNPVGNKAPDTFLFLYPDGTINQQPSKLRVSWSGDDPDGTIAGFYFKWEGIDTAWTFTNRNDSIFSLSIGTSDTVYSFLIAAADNEGNGTYDNEIIRNGTSFGREPFIDQNGDGIYNPGETYFDIGLIDPTPADLQFPIKNSPPEIEWNAATLLPAFSFPVMSFGWSANDLDGVETVVKINIALNDTTNYISMPGSVRLITIRCPDFNSANPLSEILINGSDQNVLPDKLPGIKLDDYNKLFIQAEDISGATSAFISLPQSDSLWFVLKPKGKLLIVDNYRDNSASANFYTQAFNSLAGGALMGKYDVFDLQNSPLPFENITFYETIKLFDFVFWYANYETNLDLLGLSSNRYVDQGGKIVFSLTFQDSISAYPFNLNSVQSFLPVDSLGNTRLLSILQNAVIEPDTGENYPALKTEATIGFVRTFYPSEDGEKIYNLINPALTGPVGIKSKDNDLFFIGLPLHLCNGNGNVNELLQKIFIEELGLVP